MRRKGGIRIVEGSGSSSSVTRPQKQEYDNYNMFIYDRERNGRFKIKSLIGDVSPICQVFRAEYKDTSNPSRGFQVVALKLARVDESDADEFMNLTQQVDNSIKIGPNQEGCDQIVGIHNAFYDKALYCIPMPYPEHGSIRYLLNEGIRNVLFDPRSPKKVPFGRRLPIKFLNGRRLTEKCIAVVLRETLRALCYLHQRGKVHTNVHAGNIFVMNNPVAIKLGYQASTYFYSQEGAADHPVSKIWDPLWSSAMAPIYCRVSKFPENILWSETKNMNTGIGMYYEPSNNNEQQECTPASDIFNVGVTALELALGPLRTYLPQRRRDLVSLRDFLEKLGKNETGLPRSLHMFFMVNNEIATAPTTTTAAAATTTAATECQTSNSSAGKKGKKLKSFGEEGKKFLKKAKEIILGGRKTDPKPDPQPEPEVPDPVEAMFDLSSSFVKMVKRCLALDPGSRPTASELLEDQFFKDHEGTDLKYFARNVLGISELERIPELGLKS